ncbi:Cytochrome b-c1 complex subunit 7-2 [Striga hermonthica]|uniref:DNA helicase n=1 Tax=Striga hermonthica TaxID=68872 RepID=A0A9N7P1T1_STRHE|nr:Cytochrome b-c1 complex subunit 7-2 [Striga hermonthica]
MRVLCGLRYDDLYDLVYDLDVKEALNRLLRQIVDVRNQLFKRALDLSMKHAYLAEDLQGHGKRFPAPVKVMVQAQDCLLHMGITSENVAHCFRVTRREQVQVAVSSLMKGQEAVLMVFDKMIKLITIYLIISRGDMTRGGRVAYHMTVRQLKALIRLSEALARYHFHTKVQPRYIRLAVALLKTSIINVE